MMLFCRRWCDEKGVVGRMSGVADNQVLAAS